MKATWLLVSALVTLPWTATAQTKAERALASADNQLLCAAFFYLVEAAFKASGDREKEHEARRKAELLRQVGTAKINLSGASQDPRRIIQHYVDTISELGEKDFNATLRLNPICERELTALERSEND